MYKRLTAPVLFAAFAILPIGALAQDVTPPTLTGLTLQPNPINVMTGSQTLRVAFQATTISPERIFLRPRSPIMQ